MKKESIFICLFVILLLVSIKASAQECLFITTADTVKSTDKNIAKRLEEWGYHVNPVLVDDLTNYTQSDYDKYNFAFTSEAINSTKLASFKFMPILLVNFEARGSKPTALAWSDPASAVNVAPEPVLIVDNANHPLAARYKEEDLVDLVTDPAGLMITTVPTIDVIYVGDSNNDPTKSFIYGIEKGTELTDGNITENRAVCIGIHVLIANYKYSNGMKNYF